MQFQGNVPSFYTSNSCQSSGIEFIFLSSRVSITNLIYRVDIKPTLIELLHRGYITLPGLLSISKKKLFPTHFGMANAVTSFRFHKPQIREFNRLPQNIPTQYIIPIKLTHLSKKLSKNASILQKTRLELNWGFSHMSVLNVRIT